MGSGPVAGNRPLQPNFPSNSGGQRAVIAISAVLVLVTAAMAVVTSGTPAKGAAASTTSSAPVAETPPQPEATTPTSTSTAASSEAPAATTTEAPPASTTETTATATQPKATTGTPAPPSSPAAKKPAAKPTVSSLSLAANSAGALSYDTKSLSAKAGTVTIAMANMSPVEHNVTIAEGSKVLGATPTFAGGTKTLTLKLKPGKYTFYCSVPGHRTAGMEGTLTVS